MGLQLLHRLQQLSAAHFWTKIGLLAALGIPNVVVCAIIYKVASGAAWYDALFKAYGVLYRVPGVAITGEVTTLAAIVLNIIFMFGVFVFAILLGTIADEVKNQMKTLRSGKKPVKVAAHILILNWNQKLLPLLRQISAAKANSPPGSMWHRPVVVLADRPKPDMDAVILDGLKTQNLEIYTRSGSSMRLKHLAKVAAAKASTVILLHPEGASSAAAADACQATTAIALAALCHGCPSNVVVHAPDMVVGSSNHLDLLVNAGQTMGHDFRVLPLSERTFVDRVMAHAALQPGVARVLLEILRQGEDGPQFRFVEVGGAPQQYSQLRRRYKDAVVCGYIGASGGAVQLNPKEDALVEVGDTLVLLARRGSPCKLLTPPPPTRLPAASSPRQPSAGRYIIVASFQPDALQSLAEAFQQFSPAGTTVVFIAPSPPSTPPVDGPNCRYEVVVAAQPTSCEALIKAGAGAADSVMLLGGGTGLSKPEQDACVVTAILQVHEAVATAAASAPTGRPPCHIVAGIHNHNTQELVEQLLGSFSLRLVSAELVEADEYVSAMLTQIAAEPKYGKLLEALVVIPEGNEIYLRDWALLRLGAGGGEGDGGRVTWGEIADVARASGQTALGCVMKGGELVLAPGAEEAWVVGEVEQVVVMAEDF